MYKWRSIYICMEDSVGSKESVYRVFVGVCVCVDIEYIGWYNAYAGIARKIATSLVP
jgi:hypothetical protein